MIEKDGKIIEATESELLSKWLDEEWFEIMSFPEYKAAMERAGCVVADSPYNKLLEEYIVREFRNGEPLTGEEKLALMETMEFVAFRLREAIEEAWGALCDWYYAAIEKGRKKWLN